MEIRIEKQNDDKVIEKVSEFLQVKIGTFSSDKLEEKVKELCVKKLCSAIGVRCDYNYKSDFFNFFAMISGEAVCQILNINLRVADDNLRFVRYEKVNIIDEAKKAFRNENVEEAIIDTFNIADHFKYVIKFLKKRI